MIIIVHIKLNEIFSFNFHRFQLLLDGKAEQISKLPQTGNDTHIQSLNIRLSAIDKQVFIRQNVLSIPQECFSFVKYEE